MSRVLLIVRCRLSTEDGASIVEYSLLVGLIAVVALLAVTAFGQEVTSSLDHTASNIADAM